MFDATVRQTGEEVWSLLHLSVCAILLHEDGFNDNEESIFAPLVRNVKYEL